MTATATKERKPTEATRFQYMGETLEIDAGDPRLEHVISMLATYRTRALALHVAKDAAFESEEEIKQFMQGYESLRVMGETKVRWAWKLLTKFDKRQLQKDNAALVEQYTTRVPDGSREFSANGVVGVE